MNDNANPLLNIRGRDCWTLTYRERTLWRAGYRCAEDDYRVRDLPTLLEIIDAPENLARFTPEQSEAVGRLRETVAAFNEEGTL